MVKIKYFNGEKSFLHLCKVQTRQKGTLRKITNSEYVLSKIKRVNLNAILFHGFCTGILRSASVTAVFKITAAWQKYKRNAKLAF